MLTPGLPVLAHLSLLQCWGLQAWAFMSVPLQAPSRRSACWGWRISPHLTYEHRVLSETPDFFVLFLFFSLLRQGLSM